MEDIKLYNRDGLNVYLKYIEDKDNIFKFHFIFDNRFPYSISKVNDKISFVDPSGGPMLALGQKMNINTKVMEIINIIYSDSLNNFIITMQTYG